MGQTTICWNCARATGQCPWSANLKPVKGWTATLVKPSSTKPYTTYIVHACPGFIQDAMNGGLKRLTGEQKNGQGETDENNSRSDSWVGYCFRRSL